MKRIIICFILLMIALSTFAQVYNPDKAKFIQTMLNLYQEHEAENFMNNWGQSLLSGAESGFIGGGIGSGMHGYKNAKTQGLEGSELWTGSKIFEGTTQSYSSPIKTVISPQPDKTKACYLKTDEYASAGHENYTSDDFAAQAAKDNGGDIPDAGDPLETYRGVTGKKIIVVLDPNKVYMSYSEAGEALTTQHIEMMGIVSAGGKNHAVNVLSFSVSIKYNIFGGGFHQVLSNLIVWDPLTGAASSNYNSFIKLGYFVY